MPIIIVRDRQGKRRYQYQLNRHVNGQKVRASKLLPLGWTREEAEDFDKRETARILGELHGVRRDESIESAVKAYLRDRASKLKSRDAIVSHLANIEPFYRGKSFKDFPEIVREYAKQPLSPSTIRQRLAIIRAAIRHGGGVGAENIQLPAPAKSREIYLSRRQAVGIFRKMDRRWRGVAVIAFYSGMRMSEILSAEYRGDAFYLRDTKNGQPRIIPCHPKCAVYARSLASFRQAGGRLRGDTASKQFLRAARSLSIAARFHDLRHSAASEMVNNNVDLYTVAAVLGHKSTQTTKRYAHMSQAKLVEAVGKIGKK